MKLLLDTRFLLWMMREPHLMSDSERQLSAQSDVALLASAISF